MPIINSNSNQKEKLKLDINSATLQHVQAYCKWANIDDLSSFFEEAAHFIFTKDSDWKRLKKTQKRAKANV